MAHFAKISEDNEVLNVVRLSDKNCLNAAGTEDESVGQDYLFSHNHWPRHLWIQTSFNTKDGKHALGGTPFRGSFAGIGYTWDSVNEVFWSKQPFPSWSKNIASGSWEPAAGPEPDLTAEQQSQNEADTHFWVHGWNEEAQSWDLQNMKA